MGEHLSERDLKRYRRRQWSAEELLAWDAHLTQCEACRRRLSEEPSLSQAVRALWQDLHAVAQREAHHLTYEQLEAYVEGTLSPPDRAHIEEHLRVCSLCEAEVRDLRAFERELEAPPASEAPAEEREPPRWAWPQRLRHLVFPPRTQAWAWGFTLLLLVWLGWSQFQTRRALQRTEERLTQLQRLAAGEAEGRNLQPLLERLDDLQQQWVSLRGEMAAIRRQMEERTTRLTRLQAELEATRRQTRALQARLQAWVKQASGPRLRLKDTTGEIVLTSDGRLVLPEDGPSLPAEWRARLRRLLTEGHVPPSEPVRVALAAVRSELALRGEGREEGREPLPLSPVATAVRTTHPSFRWKGVEGARRYTFVLTDRDQTQVLWEGEAGTRTSLTLPEEVPLKPGEIYAWQVEAMMEGEPRLSPWAKFWVLDEKTAAEVARWEARFRDSALLLAVLYETYGLFDEAQAQLERLKGLNPPRASEVQTMLDALTERRRRSW
jgi:hypothetical protein